MNLSIGDRVITDDGAQWRVHSVTQDGARRSFVAVRLDSSAALAADVARLTWFEAERAWRLGDPAAPTEAGQ